VRGYFNVIIWPNNYSWWIKNNHFFFLSVWEGHCMLQIFTSTKLVSHYSRVLAMSLIWVERSHKSKARYHCTLAVYALQPEWTNTHTSTFTFGFQWSLLVHLHPTPANTPFQYVLQHDSVNSAALLSWCPFCSGHFNPFKVFFYYGFGQWLLLVQM
jgi:hypothetical protein